MNRFGLIGRNIDYSFSKTYFSEKFEREKIENCSYENFDIPEIGSLKSILQKKEVKGFNVTIPYKEEVLSLLDGLSEEAREIKAVNTIRLEKDGKYIGYNTDTYGFEMSLKEKMKDDISKALILGTGGASKAVNYVLKKMGVEVTFVSRSSKTNQIAYADLTQTIIKENELIVNCSPIGTHPNIDQTPAIPNHFLTEKHFLFDLIYNPEKTLFLKKGEEKGAAIQNGLPMLKYQAEKSWKIWNK